MILVHVTLCQFPTHHCMMALVAFFASGGHEDRARPRVLQARAGEPGKGTSPPYCSQHLQDPRNIIDAFSCTGINLLVCLTDFGKKKKKVQRPWGSEQLEVQRMCGSVLCWVAFVKGSKGFSWVPICHSWTISVHCWPRECTAPADLFFSLWRQRDEYHCMSSPRQSVKQSWWPVVSYCTLFAM